MTTAPARPTTQRLTHRDVAAVTRAVESDFGRLAPGLWDPRHHYLLDALDRGEQDRFVVHRDDAVRSVMHLGVTGTAVAAGAPASAADLAPFLERSRWRILIGDEPITRVLLDLSGGSWWRRRPTVRVQRFMTVDATSTVPGGVVAGFRRAWRADLDHLEEFACLLHVEDRMGGPLAAPARQGVRQRMADSVDRGMTWVVERQGKPVGKVDLSLHSTRRGAQIAGVYVDRQHRGHGIGAGMIATLSRQLLEQGLPVVSLHVRDDNESAIAAYRRAGFIERGQWLLALR